MNIRAATADDSRFIFDLAMSEDVRAGSTRSDEFTFEQHEDWYQRRLAESGTRIYIAEEYQNYKRQDDCECMLPGDHIHTHQRPAGYVRYGRVAGSPDAEIAIAVQADCRFRGLASQMLQQTESLAAQELGVTRCIALVLVSNEPSQKLFEKADYKLKRWVMRLGKSHREYVKVLDSLWPS